MLLVKIKQTVSDPHLITVCSVIIQHKLNERVYIICNVHVQFEKFHNNTDK